MGVFLTKISCVNVWLIHLTGEEKEEGKVVKKIDEFRSVCGF